MDHNTLKPHEFPIEFRRVTIKALVLLQNTVEVMQYRDAETLGPSLIKAFERLVETEVDSWPPDVIAKTTKATLRCALADLLKHTSEKAAKSDNPQEYIAGVIERSTDAMKL